MKADDYESATTDEEEMVQDYDAKGSVDEEEDDDFYTDFLGAAIDDTPMVDVDSHVHIDVSGDGLEDDRAEDIETNENLGTGPENLEFELEVPRPVRGRRVNYRAHFQSAAALAEFRETYRIPDDVTLQLVPLGAEARPGPAKVVVPLAGICIRGIQFPFPRFVRGFLNAGDMNSIFSWKTSSASTSLGRIPFPENDLKDVLIVGGNWEFGPGERDQTHVPRAESEACSKHLPFFNSFTLPSAFPFDYLLMFTAFIANLGIVDRLKERANLERTNRAFASPERNAPKLLGYNPSYNTTLAARKKS